MKYLLILAVLSLFMVAAAPGATIGTMTLTNQPVYGGEATFYVRLDKRVQQINAVVWCRQDGFGDVFRQEHFIPYTNWSKGKWEGDIATAPLDNSDPRYGTFWDSTKPAYCWALVFKESQHGPVAITNGVDFTVPAVEP